MGNIISSAFSNNKGEGSDETSNREEELQRTKDDYLMEAVAHHDTAGVQQALRNGADVNCVGADGFGRTPLMKACRSRNNEISRILLDAGADLFWRDSQGISALHSAVRAGHFFQTAEKRHNHDNGLGKTANIIGERPLIAAIHFRRLEFVNLLLDQGANALVTNGGR